jgi:hypothetical protein
LHSHNPRHSLLVACVASPCWSRPTDSDSGYTSPRLPTNPPTHQPTPSLDTPHLTLPVSPKPTNPLPTPTLQPHSLLPRLLYSRGLHILHSDNSLLNLLVLFSVLQARLSYPSLLHLSSSADRKMAYELHSKQLHPLSDSFSGKSSVPRSSRSAAIAIPVTASDSEGCEASPASSPSSSGSSSPRSSPRSSSTTASPTAPCPKEKQNDMWAYHRRRPRLLSASS